MNGIDKIFWINSKNRADRFRNMKERLSNLNIEAERFPAIHGGEVNWNHPEYAIYHIDNVKRILNNGEKGCFLSHRTIYEMIKKEGWKKTLILEDDARFCDRFLELFDKMLPEVPEYDMLYLGQWNYDIIGEDGVMRGEKSALKEKIKTIENRDIYRAERCWLTHAYIIDHSIIDTLLDNTKNLYASIDNVLADIQEEKKLKVYAIHPVLISQDGTASSLRD